MKNPDPVSIEKIRIHTWPERTDLIVADSSGLILAHYPIAVDGDLFPGLGPLFDPLCSYEQRSRQAVHFLENEQDYLCSHYHLEQTSIKLYVDERLRQKMNALLIEKKLPLNVLSCDQIDNAITVLDALPVEDLHHLLVDWHDAIELGRQVGSSYLDRVSWVHRSYPESPYHFHYLAASDDLEKDEENAYDLFMQMVDVPLAEFNFGLLLRWIYFHRTEFSRRERFEIIALRQIRERSRSGKIASMNQK